MVGPSLCKGQCITCVLECYAYVAACVHTRTGMGGCTVWRSLMAWVPWRRITSCADHLKLIPTRVVKNVENNGK